MKKLYLIFLFLLLCQRANCENKIPITILKIYDGDTLCAKLDNGNKFSIRFKGIDCFETDEINRAYKQAYENNLKIDEVIKKGHFAKKYLKQLYNNSNEAFFEFQGVDKYGRVLGTIWFDEININEHLLNKGYCKEYKYKK